MRLLYKNGRTEWQKGRSTVENIIINLDTYYASQQNQLK